LTKTASPAIAGPGTNITYTLLVTNEGPSTVTGLVVTDPIPAALAFVSAVSSLGNCLFSNSQVVCDIGVLTNDTSATILVVASGLVLGGAVNTATMSCVEGNLAPYYNEVSASTYFISAAQRTLSIALLSNPPQVLVTWPQSSVNFLLQLSTNLALTNAWQVPALSPFLTNGLNTFTNNVAGAGAFFRLKSP
jgi:uncharacterized repeat protein (TIGR01451 family)